MALLALRCYLLVLLCWCTALRSSSAEDVCNGAEERQKCGPLEYDVNKYTCCNGNITEGPHLACCGTTAFNIMEKSCCNYTITDGLSQTVAHCCESEAYNRINQICCGGHIWNRTDAQTECCDSDFFDPKVQLCCGGKNKVVVNRTSDNDLCCINKSYNSLTHCCSDEGKVENRNSCKEKRGKTTTLSTTVMLSTSATTLSRVSSITTSKTHSQDSASPDNCSQNTNDHFGLVTQCCGSELHVLSDEKELCCDGQLYRNQSADSTCFGRIAYSPQNYTVCQKEVHFPPGQHCCGKKTFNPNTHICCNGHSHKKLDQVCCGSHPYRPSSSEQRCCSGHLHDLKYLNEEERKETGCCGTLLLTNKKKQSCCHSAEKTVIYGALPGHSCCGHWYYNQSLWSCCAGRLIPANYTPPAQAVSHDVWLGDFSATAVCNETVLLGTVESVAINQSERVIVLKYVLEVTTKSTISVTSYDQKIVQLNHCHFPVLEIGKTYLWKKVSDKCEPMANVSSLVSPVHTILSLCQSAT